jgi:O-antigen/teichoic acid export membrane protein
MLMNAMAFVPMVLIQGAGRADISAKLHVVELPLYLAVLWVLVAWYGVVGAAIAWCLRVSTDCVAHFWLSGRFLEREREALRSFLLTCIGVATTLPSALLDDVLERAVFTAAVITTISIIAWIRFRARTSRLHRKPRSAS